MAQQFNFSLWKHSVVTNITVQKDNNSNAARNVIITDSNNNKIGIWSRYKSIFHYKSHAIPLVGFSTKIHPSGTQLTDDVIYSQRDYYSKINIPYQPAHWVDHSTREIIKPQHYYTYIFPIWYIPNDSKNRILTSLQSGGGVVNNYIKWPNYKDLNGVRCYAYTKLLGYSNLTGGDRPNNKQFPYRGPLVYARENPESACFTKSFRFCGEDVPTDTTGRNIDFVDFTTDMDQYTTYGNPVTLQVTSSDWTNLRLKIDYLNQYGAQVVSTISSNTTLTIMVGSVVYATPCLVNNYYNQRNYYAAGVVSGNSISSPISFADNPTIYCGLLVDKVNLENNYPNCFRIVKNCTINLSRTGNTSTLVSGSMYIQNGRWGTEKTISTALRYTTIDWNKSTDSSYYPSTSYNRISGGGYYFWPSTGNSINYKSSTVPGGSQQNNIDQNSSGGTCQIQIWYDWNGFINAFSLYQYTGAARTLSYYLYFV